jgi:hypothetical protein
LFSKREDPTVCSGSGRIYNSDLPSRTGFYTGNWATCEECGEHVTITKAFKLRKHKKPGA